MYSHFWIASCISNTCTDTIFTIFATGSSASTEEIEENLPVTPYPCQWKVPRKRKQSNLKMADATFEKRVW